MTLRPQVDALIVGGGLAGTTVAAELARLAPAGYAVALLDPAEPGPGQAYAPHSRRLFMNGTAAAMSAVPGDKDHLVRWLRTQPAHALIPRADFGNYLRERFHDAMRHRPELGSFRTRAVDVEPNATGFAVLDDAGVRRSARNVVLALGNFPPDDSFLPGAIVDHPNFVANPWGWNPKPSRGDALVVGSGLTAMDVVALLEEQRFAGTVHVVSRHGLLPAAENPFARALDAATLGLQTQTPLALARSLRRAAREHAARGGDWRDVVEALREPAPRLWGAWSEPERRRFLRHLQSFWAVHRYRVPIETAAAFDRLSAAGRIVRHRGHVESAARRDDGLLDVGIAGPEGTQAVTVDAVFNCTGPCGDYRRLRDPLVANLLRRGLVRPDANRLGIEADTQLHPLAGDGTVNPALFALGPPLRGTLYETTAVPETCAQASRIARALVAAHAGALDAAS